jgi:CO/xanthine dehydrogenase FAD-binding subunit
MPLTQIQRYERPTDVEAAWALLRDGGAATRLLGGGTDLAVSCPPGVVEVVDLAEAGLRYVEPGEDGGFRIGAMATFTDMLEHDGLAAHASGVLAQMLSRVGSVLHRNSATVGGHLARGRMSDVIPVLLALDASVTTFDGTSRTTALRDYYAGERAPHLVLEVGLPGLPASSAAAFVRFSRAQFDHAILNGCCRIDLEDGRVAGARVVVGETAILGRRVDAAEEALVGSPLEEAAIVGAVDATREAVESRGDWVASAEYRRHLAGVAVDRCLRSIAVRLGEQR